MFNLNTIIIIINYYYILLFILFLIIIMLQYIEIFECNFYITINFNVTCALGLYVVYMFSCTQCWQWVVVMAQCVCIVWRMGVLYTGSWQVHLSPISPGDSLTTTTLRAPLMNKSGPRSFLLCLH